MAFTSSILGVGFSSPWRLDGNGSRPALAREEQLVREAMMTLLNTGIGEEPFLVQQGVPYGTRARNAVFEPEAIARDIIQYDVRRALDVWEPRISVVSVSTSVATILGRGLAIAATILFTYRTTNRDDNLVVPYYLQKQSGV